MQKSPCRQAQQRTTTTCKQCRPLQPDYCYRGRLRSVAPPPFGLGAGGVWSTGADGNQNTAKGEATRRSRSLVSLHRSRRTQPQNKKTGATFADGDDDCR